MNGYVYICNFSFAFFTFVRDYKTAIETTIWWFSLKLPIDSVYFHFLNILKRKSFSGWFEFEKRKKTKKKDQNEKKWKKEIGQQTYAIECMHRYKQIKLHSLPILFINRKLIMLRLAFYFFLSLFKKNYDRMRKHMSVECVKRTYQSCVWFIDFSNVWICNMHSSSTKMKTKNKNIFTFHSISYAIPDCIPKLSYWAIE